MSHRTALVISTALTVIILLTGIGLAVRAADSQTGPEVDDSADAVPVTVDVNDLQREYIDQLETSNDALTASFERIAALLDDIDQLKAQNATLLEREAVYEQRLSEANARLQQAGRSPVPTVATTVADDSALDPSPESEAAAAPADEPAAPSTAAISVSPRLALATGAPASVSGRPVAPATRAPEVAIRGVVPTATRTIANRPAPSIFAPAQRDPSEAVAARAPTPTPRAAPAPTAIQLLPTSQPPALVASQPPPATRLVATAQPTPIPTTASLVASAKPSQTHDGDDDADDRSGDGKDYRNDRRRR